MIDLIGINKTFRVHRRKAGFGSALKALFSRQAEEIHALKDVSFHIGEGEIVGYIGPNGAGKSTTIKVMCGILTPDSGSCCINGLVPWQERKRHVAHIGAVFGQRSQLWWDVPVIDSFELIRDIYAISDSVYRRNLADMSDLLNLSEVLKTPARNLSLGQRMRCELAASLLHDPKILFLDEPTIGLDATSKIAVRKFILEMNRLRHTTVILTTHDMLDIEALTNRILFLGKGQILLDGSMDSLKKRFAQKKKLQVEYSGPRPALVPGMNVVEEEQGRLTLEIQPDSLPIPAAIEALSEQVEILDLSVSSISSEEMVAELYKSYSLTP